MYRQLLSAFTGEIAPVIFRIADNTSIPFDPDNTDYQEYLKWLAAGNTPLPPDAPAQQEGAAQ